MKDSKTPKITIEEYKAKFAEPKLSDNKDDKNEYGKRAERALAYALDIRKFEIELYWKRATYFWTFIAAAFAGYGLTYETANSEPWLSVLFAGLGIVFSFAWYLVNRGSKFWQSNWERHVDILEDMTLGPLYKVVAVTDDNFSRNQLTSPAQFSVSKINQILSVFVSAIWLLLLVRALLPISTDLPLDCYKIAIVMVVITFLVVLYLKGKSSNQYSEKGLYQRGV